MIAEPQGDEPHAWALIMDDPDAMAAVGKVWVHWLQYWEITGSDTEYVIEWQKRLW